MGRGVGPSAAARAQVQGPRHVGVRYISIDVALFQLFQVVDGEESAVSQGLLWRRAASLFGLVQHRLRRSAVGGILRHPLGHDQMIVGDGEDDTSVEMRILWPAERVSDLRSTASHTSGAIPPATTSTVPITSSNLTCGSLNFQGRSLRLPLRLSLRVRSGTQHEGELKVGELLPIREYDEDHSWRLWRGRPVNPSRKILFPELFFS